MKNSIYNIYNDIYNNIYAYIYIYIYNTYVFTIFSLFYRSFISVKKFFKFKSNTQIHKYAAD